MAWSPKKHSATFLTRAKATDSFIILKRIFSRPPIGILWLRDDGLGQEDYLDQRISRSLRLLLST